MIRAAILAGGQSKRFGEDKAMAFLGEKTLLGHSVDIVRQINLEPILLAPEDRGYGKIFSCEVLEDDCPGEGPLAALASLWNRYPKDTFLVLTCDMPRLSAKVLAKLLFSHEPSHAVTLFQTYEDPEPFPGIYQSEICRHFYQKINDPKKSMALLINGLTQKKILRWENISDAFLNINYPSDIQSLSSIQGFSA